MPGPVSDSFDPEFTTGENASDVNAALAAVADKFSWLGPPKYIVDVVTGGQGESHLIPLSERELRIIRFAIGRARESI